MHYQSILDVHGKEFGGGMLTRCSIGTVTLHSCKPLEEVKRYGMTFDEIQCLGMCNGLEVNAKRANQTTFTEFLDDLRTVSSSTDSHIILSFSRKTLSQTGDGHFSPIGCFEPESNQVLVLDTARFKYPPYFVNAQLLFESLKPLDSVTQLPRGYFIVKKKGTSSLYRCDRTSAVPVKDIAC
jgi:glutathione gamma-glutamylcysteinyltransferase